MSRSQAKKITVSFDTTPEEDDYIIQILDRAQELGFIDDADDWCESQMDLEATNANGCPMDFKRWLEADDFNFKHDFYGIYNHLNRRTGKLMDFFLPRFAKNQGGECE